MLFCITGASGSGKSACLSGLRRKHPEIDWHDFDDLPFTPSTTAERQIGTEYWMQVAASNARDGRDTGLAGSCIPGEILACPSSPDPTDLRFLLLDCNDVIRVDRIRRRDLSDHAGSQDMLSWAAWQRMHAVDPQWRPDVIRTNGAPEMMWERWNTWTRGDQRWHVAIVDTTGLAIPEMVEQVANWIARHHMQLPETITHLPEAVLVQAAGA
jgi:hypothetical protein